jgi:hypothetical protein
VLYGYRQRYVLLLRRLRALYGGLVLCHSGGSVLHTRWGRSTRNRDNTLSDGDRGCI